MSRFRQRLDAALFSLSERRKPVTGIFLDAHDLNELVEDLDAGDCEKCGDGRYSGFTVHEISDGPSYVTFERQGQREPGRIDVDLLTHPAFRFRPA